MDRVGVLYAIAAYIAWGVFPIFWKLLKAIPSTEIMLHRIVWAFVFYLLLTFVTGKAKLLLEIKMRSWPLLIVSSLLISLNWYLYIYAVNSNHILQGSLGYYINPIFSFFMGVLLLGEKMSRAKIYAGALCGLAVVVLTVALGELPWISLVLAATFAFYGYVRKKSQLDALVHSTFELIFIFPLAVALLIYVRGESSVIVSPREWSLLVLSGAVTGFPLLWFSKAAQKIPLNALGFFQYIAPTLQFFCGVLIYGETISLWQMLAFVLIWIGLAIFILDSHLQRAR